MRDAPLSPVPCMDAPMPRARTCSPTRFARSSCLMTGAGAATQGYFLLLVQEKVAKENDTPDGATQPCAPQALGPALILRGILPRRSGADILSAPPSGRSPKGLVMCRKHKCRGREPVALLASLVRPALCQAQERPVLGFAPYGDPRKPHISGLCFRCHWCSASPRGC